MKKPTDQYSNKPGQKTAYTSRQRQPPYSSPQLLWGGVAGIMVIIIAVGFIIFFKQSPAGIDSGASTPVSSVSPTSVPIIDPDLAERQLVATTQRWTDLQTIGIDCIGTVCTQEVTLGLTLLTPALLEDTVRAGLAGKPDDKTTIEEQVSEIKQRLIDKNSLTLALVIIPGRQSVNLRSELMLGELTRQLTLLDDSGNRYLLLKYNPVFDQPVPLDKQTKGHLFFPLIGTDGQPVDGGSSLTIRLELDKSLNSDKNVVTWVIDLLPPTVVPPATPAPTPNATATKPPLIDVDPKIIDIVTDKEVVLSVVDLLKEMVR